MAGMGTQAARKALLIASSDPPLWGCHRGNVLACWAILSGPVTLFCQNNVNKSVGMRRVVVVVGKMSPKTSSIFPLKQFFQSGFAWEAAGTEVGTREEGWSQQAYPQSLPYICIFTLSAFSDYTFCHGVLEHFWSSGPGLHHPIVTSGRGHLPASHLAS